VIAEIVVELEDFRTGNNQSAQGPVDEQTLMPSTVVNRGQMMEEESPAVPSSVQNLTTSASSESHAFDRRGVLYSSLSAGGPPLIATVQCISPFSFLCLRPF
jgi:hypothetical protein